MLQDPTCRQVSFGIDAVSVYVVVGQGFATSHFICILCYSVGITVYANNSFELCGNLASRARAELLAVCQKWCMSCVWDRSIGQYVTRTMLITDTPQSMIRHEAQLTHEIYEVCGRQSKKCTNIRPSSVRLHTTLYVYSEDEPTPQYYSVPTLHPEHVQKVCMDATPRFAAARPGFERGFAHRFTDAGESAWPSPRS